MHETKNVTKSWNLQTVPHQCQRHHTAVLLPELPSVSWWKLLVRFVCQNESQPDQKLSILTQYGTERKKE